MGCGCGKRKGATAARSVQMGRTNGQPAVKVRTLRNAYGVDAGKEVYASGSEVQRLVDEGYLEFVTTS